MTAVLDPFKVTAEPAEANGGRHAEIRAEMTEVTPAPAKEWTRRHEEVVALNRAANGGKARDNRPLRLDDVAAYARDMKAGNWDRNGETVKIAWDETVVDGQHRLYACQQAGVPFWTLVVHGVDPKAQDTVDTGIRRKLNDQLAIANEKNAVVLASVSRWALRWTRGHRGGTARGQFNPTHAEVLAFLAATPRLRDAAAFAVRARQSFKSVRGSAYGMAWMLFTGLDDVAAAVFFEHLLTGADLPMGHPALAFRQRIWNARENDERLSEQEQLALMVVAWNAWREGRKISRLQLPKGGLTPKNFPEPK